MIPGVERRALSTLAIRREGRAEQDATVAPKAALEDRNIVRGIVSGRDGRSLRPCMTEIHLHVQQEKCAHLDVMTVAG